MKDRIGVFLEMDKENGTEKKIGSSEEKVMTSLCRKSVLLFQWRLYGSGFQRFEIIVFKSLSHFRIG